jgi:hypothetical protein
MKENKDEQTTSISKAQTLEEIADFWDTNSTENRNAVRTRLRPCPCRDLTFKYEL